MSWELRQRLERVARRIRSLRLWTTLALCWLAWACVGVMAPRLAAFLDWKVGLSIPMLAALATFTAVICGYAALRSARDHGRVARRIEARHPELASLLVTAVEQAPAHRGQALGFLQHSVIHDAVKHGRAHDWTRIIAGWKIGLAKAAHVAALLLLGIVCINAGRDGARASSAPDSAAARDTDSDQFDVDVEPGDVELERGTSLVVVARFKGDVPAEATLIVADASAGSSAPAAVEAHDMSRPLDDPKFVGRVASLINDLVYYVESDGWQSKKYRARVFDYPDLLRADADLDFPQYTGMDRTIVEDIRHVSAVEGTQLTLRCRLNKRVAEARLVASDGEEHVLTADKASPTVYAATWTLTESRRFKLHLIDAEARKNRLPPEIAVNVTPNRPPKIVIQRPGRDTEVSPLEELQLNAGVSDDYGLLRGGISYALGGDETRDFELFAAGTPVAKEQAIEYLIDFESLAAQPDQLLTYFFWAEDYGADGKSRRTMSDMFFAEVRHFEQIFRQGEQPPGGAQQEQSGSPNSEAARELAELEKEIINATWKLIRREFSAEPTPEFASDAKLLQESQQTAMERAGELASRLQDEQSAAHLKHAAEQMQTALEHLTKAARGLAVDPLGPALAAEQQAYQSLLKLRAREVEVVNGNRQQGGGASGSAGRMQQQLNELELKAEENRYETQSQARSSEETLAQRDSRDILNRLRELARRQEDLNDRLKELQSALEQAQTAERQEELRRELKRLRDQQQQILRDTDEMIGRMDRSENRERMDRAREQAADSRSHQQQASEALEAGELSQALTEGARAGRQLSELRDEFRKQAANRFSEEMTELRRDARRLDEEQQRLSNQLADGSQERGRGLRDTGQRAEVGESLKQQREDFKELMDRMQQTIKEAEQPEPLLARQLYDTVRQAHQHKIEGALDISERLLEVGIEREAGQAMRIAGRRINEVRRGVERAAESVLGDETEALRRAQQEVEQLADELEREIDAAQGDDVADDSEASRSSRDRNPAEGVANKDDASTPSSDGAGSEPNRNQESPLTGAGNENTEREGQPNGQSNRRTARSRGSLRGSPQENSRGGEAGGYVDDLEELLGGLGVGRGGPITGERFREWSDRMRNVEEMLEDSELRGQAARIRDRARQARGEYKRHARMPDWKKLEQLVAEPLNELGRHLSEEIRRRQSPDALVPIDRDPVPPEFTEQVRRYYERLGSGE